MSDIVTGQSAQSAQSALTSATTDLHDHDPVSAELAKRAARGATRAADPGNKRPARSGWMRLVDVVTWPMGFLLDRNDRPSTSKVMGFAILAVYAIGHGDKLPITVVLALIASSFGYTAWKDFVAKGSWGVTSTDAVKLELQKVVNQQTTEQRSENIQHTITETRGPTGEPMRSLPPVPGATTPNGET